MKPSDKQAYLEEYEQLKKKGKPFFPYAVMKDTVMMLIVALVIVALSILLGAEQGADVFAGSAVRASSDLLVDKLLQRIREGDTQSRHVHHLGIIGRNRKKSQ